jgi:hypothetical protein
MDNDGNPHRARRLVAGERGASDTCLNIQLPNNVPSRFGVIFTTVPPTAGRIPFLRVVIQRGSAIEMRDIQVPYKRKM